mgnify:CR=1 FL=1
MIARVRVTLKPGLLDAQGKTVKQALESLGFRGVQNVRVGKYIEVELAQAKTDAAKREVERMCEKLLANPVIERCQIELSGGRS